MARPPSRRALLAPFVLIPTLLTVQACDSVSNREFSDPVIETTDPPPPNYDPGFADVTLSGKLNDSRRLAMGSLLESSIHISQGGYQEAGEIVWCPQHEMRKTQIDFGSSHSHEMQLVLVHRVGMPLIGKYEQRQWRFEDKCWVPDRYFETSLKPDMPDSVSGSSSRFTLHPYYRGSVSISNAGEYEISGTFDASLVPDPEWDGGPPELEARGVFKVYPNPVPD